MYYSCTIESEMVGCPLFSVLKSMEKQLGVSEFCGCPLLRAGVSVKWGYTVCGNYYPITCLLLKLYKLHEVK